MRTFVAVVPEPNVINRLEDVQRELKMELAGYRKDVSWVLPGQSHITLAFLGDVPEDKLESVCGTVEYAVRNVRPFDITIEGTGIFGKNAHTLWAAVTDGFDEISELRQTVSEPLAKKEFFTPSKRFEPHITMARFKTTKPSRIVKHINYSMNRYKFGRTRVDTVCVFTTELTKLGPEYTCIAEYYLR